MPILANSSSTFCPTSKRCLPRSQRCLSRPHRSRRPEPSAISRRWRLFAKLVETLGRQSELLSWKSYRSWTNILLDTICGWSTACFVVSRHLRSPECIDISRAASDLGASSASPSSFLAGRPWLERHHRAREAGPRRLLCCERFERGTDSASGLSPRRISQAVVHALVS